MQLSEEGRGFVHLCTVLVLVHYWSGICFLDR